MSELNKAAIFRESDPRFRILAEAINRIIDYFNGVRPFRLEGQSRVDIRLHEGDATTDEKVWGISTGDTTSGVFEIAVRNDEETAASKSAAIAIGRTGTTIDSIQLNATTLDFNGNGDFSGTLAAHGIVEIANTGDGGLYAQWILTGTGARGYVGSRAGLIGSGVGFGVRSESALFLSVGTSEKLVIDSSGNFDFKSGTVTTNNASGSEVGYKGVPFTDKTDNYQFVLADAGKGFRQTGASKTMTIPAQSSVNFPTGTVIVVMAGSSSVSIAITTDTLRLAGTSSTGTRTLAAFGLCTLTKYTSQGWMISGAGVS